MSAANWLKRKVEAGDLPWEDLSRMVQFAQGELGVEADGKWGAKSAAALLERMGPPPTIATPIPKGRSGVKRVYGEFTWEWEPNPRDRRVKADPAWVKANIKRFELHDGRKRRMHKLVGDEFAVIFKKACKESGYTPTSVQTFNPRKMRAKEDSDLSYHSWGIAVDFDPAHNPWGGVKPNGEPSLMRQNMKFVEVFEEAGWTWGGRWRKGKGDDMHFERKQ